MSTGFQDRYQVYYCRYPLGICNGLLDFCYFSRYLSGSGRYLQAPKICPSMQMDVYKGNTHRYLTDSNTSLVESNRYLDSSRYMLEANRFLLDIGSYLPPCNRYRADPSRGRFESHRYLPQSNRCLI